MATPGNNTKSYCRYCKSEMHAHHGELRFQGKKEEKEADCISLLKTFGARLRLFCAVFEK